MDDVMDMNKIIMMNSIQIGNIINDYNNGTLTRYIWKHICYT